MGNLRNKKEQSMLNWMKWILWKRWFRLSETTIAVLYLWEHDAKNWRIGSHAAVHQQTGVGIWTANKEYGLHLYFEIPDDDRITAHPCSGHQIDVCRRDRRAIYRTVVLGISVSLNRELQRQIADWMTDNIAHHVRGRTSARVDR
jgi:hypothetical protein